MQLSSKQQVTDIDPFELAQRFFEETNDGFIIFNPGSRKIVDVNPALRRLTAFSKKELVGSLVTKFLIASTEKANDDLLGAFQNTTFFHSREDFQLRTQDARTLAVNVSVSRIHTDNSPLGLIVVRDITERVMAERLRDGQNQVLEALAVGKDIHATLEILVNVIETLSDGMLASILLLEQNRLVKGASPSLPAKYNDAIDGLEIGPCVGSCGTAAYTKELVVVEDVLTDPLWAPFLEVVTQFDLRACWSQPIIVDGVVLGTFAMYYSQPRKPTRAELRLIGEFANVAGIAIARHAEIREQNAIREKIMHMQRLESLGVLAGGIAHDFNNLLVGILGNAEIISQQLPAGSPSSSGVELIEKSAHMAADLCQQLLAYAGKSRLHIAHTSLNELISDLSQLLAVSTPANVAIERDLKTELEPVCLDAGQIRQVVMNLITNASEAIGEGGGRVRIATGTVDGSSIEQGRHCYGTIDQDKRYQFLTVRDSGIGMSEPTMSRMFEPFFTTRVNGRGLGLAAALGIVQRHRGVIRVESEPERGTAVHVYFPAEVDDDTSTRVNDMSATDFAQNSGTVLLVNDIRTAKEQMVWVLEQNGFEVIRASDLRTAIEVFEDRKDRVDAVLLDSELPTFEAVQLIESIREIQPDAPIVLRIHGDNRSASDVCPIVPEL